ncbi:DNA damage-inducible protein D [Bifidobacterium sp.]|uniref:DNA damage-inducible protein D n=1 Tax=Bifidobacterium sp. TaxID=41200 RepID=UPI0025C67345|nr:DNA damage-inducible protein D [Bifidobacterium sp.]MCH4209409.1 DNA damage-inducible protein D [Bifidobacterium sp.]MCI1224988.1 DNA damage-inducible protein D [Bifidobacterium sp.]
MDEEAIGLRARELDDLSRVDGGGVEFWFAREIMTYMGYRKWENFSNALERAQDACQNSGIPVQSHFQKTDREVELGSGAKRSIRDIRLTRYACYLVAQNGDPRKETVALLQSYFALQTRSAELIGRRMEELGRIATRHALSDEERRLSDLGYERGVDDRGFGIIRSKGDRALFGMSTAEMKSHIGAPRKDPLADRLHPIAVTAKQLATQMTNYGIEGNDLHGANAISNEHVANNSSVRKALVERGVAPEDLPAAEDIKRVERRAKEDERRIEGTGFGTRQEETDIF